jgi:hypothetical protein
MSTPNEEEVKKATAIVNSRREQGFVVGARALGHSDEKIAKVIQEKYRKQHEHRAKQANDVVAALTPAEA